MRILRRRLAAALVALVAAGATVLAAPAPAQAYVGANVLRNHATGLCLTTSFLRELYTKSCDTPIGNHGFQMWQPIWSGVVPSGDVVQVQNVVTKMCLNVPEIGYVEVGACADQMFAQAKWVASGSGWNRVELISNAGGGCLDSNAVGQVYQLWCNGGGYQAWSLGY